KLVCLFNVGEDPCGQARTARPTVDVAGPLPRGEGAKRALKVVGCQPKLLQVVRTLHPICRLADLLDCAAQKADQDCDDRDDDQQLNERKTRSTTQHSGTPWFDRRSAFADEEGG